ncbi:hypothetical protein K3169_28585 [Pseudomonas phytophila]|uniref:NACHT-associated inactive Restriction Endonuclease 2 domain-containing protein n=1 Tax=Pseudomonas phytophila TaxID=2867264 RepID=A0ABY6FE60_9PSED|nr:hypothetical protein [Pseudomonas phytophila]UXZ96191.1 hypothetical protein K3169_28585 [Pseudomonas phytophila]
MIDTTELKKIYKQYGFEEAKSNEPDIHVFTYRSGHFHNADIVKVSERGDEEKVFSQFKRSGYACRIREYQTTTDIESTLFKGFFSVDSTRSKLKREYERYVDAIAKAHSDDGTYQYINSHYLINDRQGEQTVVQEIYSRLSIDKPTLFLIEAAAGFGKTCAAYELLKEIVTQTDAMVPLFSELSRNRQAKIFRYVLLDEIDRSFPNLRSGLVRAQIQNGNVPVILDGFDELLPQSKANQDTDDYDATEPMLETIGELLKKSAKVILTTRRTAIFDGDEFHSWVDRHNQDFEVFRIRISEPTIQDWIPPIRLAELSRMQFPIERLNNPVLLAYLRCITNSEFEEVIRTPNGIVEKYFSSMLERERKRQDLRVLPTDQYRVLKTIANDMIHNNYTAESKEYISDLILKSHPDILDNARRQYPIEEKPSLGELVTKLAGHALLDKSNEDTQGIGFVNEFVLGNFCAEIIIDDISNEWVGGERFIEPSVIATIPRDAETKLLLWRALQFSFEFLPATEKVLYTSILTGSLDIELENDSVEGIELQDLTMGRTAKIENFLFINCKFTNVTFCTGGIISVSFANCRFYNCGVTHGDISSKIHALGCFSDTESFLEALQGTNGNIEDITKRISDAELFVLEKFWPRGRNTLHKHRPIRIVCSNTGTIPQDKILEAISTLRRQGIITNGDKNSVLELNLEFVAEIKAMLGRS